MSQTLTNLKPNTEYHSASGPATNAAGTTTTLDQTFAYPITAAGGEDRQYQQVTPKEKNGALIDAFFGNAALTIAPQISESGSSMIALSVQCFDGTPSCTALRQEEGEPYEFERGRWAGSRARSRRPPPSIR